MKRSEGNSAAVKSILKAYTASGGFYLAAAYVSIVLIVFGITAATTKPSNVGYDWIPFVMLSMPWYSIDARLLIPGFIANACIMYLFGSLLQMLRRRAIKRLL